jgi:hypothetical protein
MTKITGRKAITVTTVDGTSTEVSVRQIPIRQFDDFAALLGGKATGLGAQAHGLAKLFTGTDDEFVDVLSHESVQEIVKVGLEMNSGFFASYPALLSEGMAGVQKAVENAAVLRSSSGSSTASPSPAGP